MHELGIAQGMLEAAIDQAAKSRAARIVAFNVEMSAAADESEDSLRFHLENLIRARWKAHSSTLLARLGAASAWRAAMNSSQTCRTSHARVVPAHV